MKPRINKMTRFLRFFHPFSDRFFSFGTKSGFSLIEILTASSIIGLLGYGLTRMSGTAFQAASISNNSQDLASLKMVIREQVSCPLTLGLPANYDFSVPVACGGPYLLRKAAPSGSVQLGTSIAGDPERTLIGNYKVRATCSGNQLQIMVESTRLDPLTKTILPPRNLFAGAGGSGLCSQYFTGATCPAGKVVTGVANGVPVCSAVASCPTGQVQTGVSNGVPVCANSGGCPSGQVQTGTSNGLPVCTVPQACTPPWYAVGYSNGLPVCQYWNGCPAGTVYRGTLSGGTWPVCDPEEVEVTGDVGSPAGLCSIPVGSFNRTGYAYCPSGYSVISGTVTCDNSGGGPVNVSRPLGTTGWVGVCCAALNGGSGGTIFIRCRKN